MIIGVDIGRGYVKATDLNKFIIFPSFVAEYRERNLENENDNYVITINNQSYFVGELAKTEGGVREFVKNKSEQNLLPLILTALNLFNDCNFDIVVGLPISDYKIQKEKLIDKIKGTYKTVFKNQEKNITINSVLPFPEGAGALWGLCLDTFGNFINPQFLEKRIGVIDIGYKTVDICLVNKLKYEDARSTSIPIGLHEVYMQVYKRLSTTKDILPEDIETQEQYPEYQQLALKIESYINQLWKGNIDEIYLCGGGAQMLQSYLKINTKMLPNPIFANVVGFTKVGYWRWKKCQCEYTQSESQNTSIKSSLIWKMPPSS